MIEKIEESEEITNSQANFEIVSSLNPQPKESVFQTIIVAFLRHKQLNGGAIPRIEVPSLKTKKTKIAIGEAMQGLIVYSQIP